MAATAPAVAPCDQTGNSTATNDLPESMQLRLQKQRIETKYGQLQHERRAAHALRIELEQTRTNKKTDEQIMLLMQADERLAALLSQAAESMCALLPDGLQTADAAVPSTSPDVPSYGAKAFEIRAQSWFSILNEVQYTMRSAMRHLREAQLAPLAAPAGPEARASGLAGSAGQGHSLSLMNAFVDISGSDGATFKLPPTTSAATKRSQLPALDKTLSIHALRERERNWKELSRSLQKVEQSLSASPDKPAAAQQSSAQSHPQAEDATIVEALRKGAETDKLLLQALLKANGLSL